MFWVSACFNPFSWFYYLHRNPLKLLQQLPSSKTLWSALTRSSFINFWSPSRQVVLSIIWTQTSYHNVVLHSPVLSPNLSGVDWSCSSFNLIFRGFLVSATSLKFSMLSLDKWLLSMRLNSWWGGDHIGGGLVSWIYQMMKLRWELTREDDWSFLRLSEFDQTRWHNDMFWLVGFKLDLVFGLQRVPPCILTFGVLDLPRQLMRHDPTLLVFF